MHSFVGQSSIRELCPPALLFLEGERTEGRRKREVLHLFRCYTHRDTDTGFTNDNRTITKTITFGIKNCPCETLPCFTFCFFPFPLPFLSLSCPFSCLFLYSSFSFSFPFSCPFSFPFSFPFPFLFLSFSFPFPFAFFFLSLSFSFPFPFLFLSLSYSFLSLPLLFLFLSPFLAHVNSLIKVLSQRLEKR